MKKTILAAALLSAGLLTGCMTATGYRPAVHGPLGYNETILAPDRWLVTVHTNVNTTRQQAQQILMRRAAELTLERGKRYFVLNGHDSWTRPLYYPSGIEQAPSNEATVSAVAVKEEDAFDAIEVIEQTDEFAKGRLSDEARASLQRLRGSATASL
jgi:hypothetical protein